MTQHDTSRQMKTKTTCQQYFGMSCHVVSSSIQVPVSPRTATQNQCVAVFVPHKFPKWGKSESRQRSYTDGSVTPPTSWQVRYLALTIQHIVIPGCPCMQGWCPTHRQSPHRHRSASGYSQKCTAGCILSDLSLFGARISWSEVWVGWPC